MAGDSNRHPAERLILFACHVVGWFWNTLTFVPWYYLSGNYKKLKYGAIQAKSTHDPSGPYRAVEFMDKLVVGHQGVTTLDKLFRIAVDMHGKAPALGTRELLAEEDELQSNGRTFKKVILGQYKWLTYNDVFEHARRLASGIQALGIAPKEYVCIFAETKAEWMITAQACFMRNFPLVTIYATLGDDALVHGFNEAEAAIVFTDAALLPKLKSLMTQLHYLKMIVYFGDVKKSVLSDFPIRVQLFSMQQVQELGAKLENLEAQFDPPKDDDLAVIMYTSGSTGVPKGVMMSHFNVTCAVGALAILVPGLGPLDTCIGYLPLAHILELACEISCLRHGTKIGYSSALTLSDQSSKIKKGSKGDVSVLKPTLMAAVPMIMDRIRKTVTEQLQSRSPLQQLFFRFAYDYKLRLVRKGYDTPILNRLIFNKIRRILGGNVRVMLSGGAPLSSETQEFMNVCFCCPVSQGYGLTETCAGGTLTHMWDQSTGRVGRPIGSAMIRLVSWAEGSYTVNDKPYPRGEIVIGGNCVTMGYLKQPEKTAECYTREFGHNWFYTGDIGEIHEDGVLKIIDRKKDLIKLSHGEYVSLSKVECALAHSKFVENCCVYGSPDETFVIVLVVPAAKHLHALADSLGLSDQPFEALCENKTIVKEVSKDLLKVCEDGKLLKAEIPQKVKLCSETWTPESELVTAAFKLKRKNIQEHYQADIDALYSS